MNRHLTAIESGIVTKSNVIGLRKALNADYRRSRGYSESLTAPKLRGTELAAIMNRLGECKPIVDQALADSGIALLTDKRYRKRLERVAHILPRVSFFRLIRFDDIKDGHFVPVYRACTPSAESFVFRNIPWQAAHWMGLESGPTLESE